MTAKKRKPAIASSWAVINPAGYFYCYGRSRKEAREDARFARAFCGGTFRVVRVEIKEITSGK